MGESNPFDHYTVNFDIGGGGTAIDIGIDELANALKEGVTVHAGLNDIHIKELATSLDAKITQLVPIEVRAAITQLVPIEVRAAITQLPQINTDSKVDLGLDNIRIAEFPPIQLELGMRPVRVHLPLNYSFSFELFGFKLFKFSICGEAMVVSEDYKPHATERCE
jgi:hypothetical protein